MPMMASSTPSLPALLHQIVEQGDQTVAALEREALLAHVLGMQVALQSLRGGQLPEDVLLLIGAEAALQARHLEIILQPQALVGVRYVRELRADGIGVDEFQVRENILELGALGDRVIAAAGEELGVEIGIRQAEIFEVEHIGLGALLQTQRIQVGDQVAAVRVDLDETRHGALLGACRRHDRAARRPRCRARRRFDSRAARRSRIGVWATSPPAPPPCNRPK